MFIRLKGNRQVYWFFILLDLFFEQMGVKFGKVVPVFFLQLSNLTGLDIQGIIFWKKQKRVFLQDFEIIIFNQGFINR